MLQRVWIPLVLVAVLALGGFTVSRIRGFFASEELPTYAGSMSDDGNNSDPKIVRYEIFGAPNTTADINYLSAAGDPVQLSGVALPWSLAVESQSPAMVANIVAQGDSTFIGCRISTDGDVLDERTSNEVSAYVYCIAKSA